MMSATAAQNAITEGALQYVNPTPPQFSTSGDYVIVS